MGLESILERPSVSELLKRKLVKERLSQESNSVRYYLSYLIDRLKPNETLVINPEYQIVFESSLRTLHKLNLIKMRRYDSLETAISEKATPESLFINSLNHLRQNESYVGWDWQGIMHTSREYRIVFFTENYQAQLMLKNATREEKSKVKPYIGNRGDLKVALEMALEIGGHIDLSVPSLSKKDSKEHSFAFSHYPLVRKAKDISCNWFNLRWNHVCKEQEFYPLHYGRFLEDRKLRQGVEIVADAHVIFGFKITKSEINAKNYGAYVAEDPFFDYSNYSLNTLNKLYTQVVKEYFVKTKKGFSIRRRLMHNGEINKLFGDLILYNLKSKSKSRNPGHLVFLKFFKS